MADQEVVIIDDKGVEHVFPEGFDPKKAAGIVREQANPAPATPSLADMMHPSSVPINEAGEKLGPDGKPLHGFNKVVEEMKNPSPGQDLGVTALTTLAGAFNPSEALAESLPEVAMNARTGASKGLLKIGPPIEKIGTKATKLSPYGLMEAAVQGDVNGLKAAAVPYGVKYLGRGLTKLGKAIEPSSPAAPDVVAPKYPAIAPSPLSAEETTGILSRGAQMGDRTGANMRAAGLDFPKEGMRSPQDIDQFLQSYYKSIAKGPEGEPPMPTSASIPVPKPSTGPSGGLTVEPSSDLEKMMLSMQHETPSGPPSAGNVVPEPMTKRMNLPASKSSRDMSKVDPRMSMQDQLMFATIMKANPRANPEEVVAELLKERAMRGNMYRSGGM